MKNDTFIKEWLENAERIARIQEESDAEYFKNRQPKGYHHLPYVANDLREIADLLELPQHDSLDQDQSGWFRDLLLACQ